jgi:hypothetical protein
MLWMAIHCSRSPDSTLGMESEEKFFNSQLWKTNFLHSEAPRLAVGRAQSRFQWILGSLAPGANQPGHRVDCSPPSSAEIKNEWSHTSIPPNVFMTCTGTLLFRISFNSPNIIELSAVVSELVNP